MRHKHKGNRLSRKSSHRLSLLQNLSSDLILHESVETTLAKAKELKRYAEKMITKANTVKGYEKSVYENFLLSLGPNLIKNEIHCQNLKNIKQMISLYHQKIVI